MYVYTKFSKHHKSRTYARIVLKGTKNIHMADISAEIANGENRPKRMEMGSVKNFGILLNMSLLKPNITRQ